MRHLWWGLIPFVAALMAIRTWWAELADIVGLVALAGGSSLWTRLRRLLALGG